MIRLTLDEGGFVDISVDHHLTVDEATRATTAMVTRGARGLQVLMPSLFVIIGFFGVLVELISVAAGLVLFAGAALFPAARRLTGRSARSARAPRDDGVMRYVALLRGINVGGKNKVAMAGLRELLAGLGHTAVRTHLNSGNAVFTTAGEPEPAPAEVAAAIERAIAAELGLDLKVMVRTGPRLRAIIDAAPTAVTGSAKFDPAKFTVAFLAGPVKLDRVRGLDLSPYAPDEIHPAEHELYIHFPNGLGRSKLGGALERLIGAPATMRNWNTVTKLAALAEE